MRFRGWEWELAPRGGWWRGSSGGVVGEDGWPVHARLRKIIRFALTQRPDDELFRRYHITTMAAKTMSKTVSTKRKREESVSARKIRVLEEETATTQVDDMRSSEEDEDMEDEDEEEEELNAAEIFRRHFEARFKPLPDVKEKKGGKKGTVVAEEDEDEDEEWGGLSEGSEDDEEEEDSDDDDGVKRRKIDVVEHTSAVSAPKMSKAELKAFMVRSQLIFPPSSPLRLSPPQ